MAKESKRLLEQAEKLYRQGIDKLQSEVILSIELLREELVDIANQLRGEKPNDELRNEIKKLLPVVRRLAGEEGPPPKANRLRAPKISIDEKVAWLVKALEGKKNGIGKSDLIRAYAEAFGCKPSPTIIDAAIADPRFKTSKSGKSVTVFLKDQKGSE
ncbi:MAG: hypothetical protein NTW52_18620 [Planctomycetota bacterium]|nr:hypothetical protein [Planctomycetota bacterium]